MGDNLSQIFIGLTYHFPSADTLVFLERLTNLAINAYSGLGEWRSTNSPTGVTKCEDKIRYNLSLLFRDD